MKKQIIYWLALGLVVIIGCQKELSFETGNAPGHGSLQSDVSGDCLPKTVNGIYAAGTPLIPATNTITLQINVTQTGTYVVTTDTVNGFFFRATGTFTTLGANTLTLRSNGTPFAAGINNFVVSYDSSFCDIAVTVLPAGAGAAVYTLAGAPGSCTTPTIAGGYGLGIPLNATNTVTINVNVTTIGSYNISTTSVGGMVFAKSGAFTVTGPQTVVLVGTGTPTVVGANTIPVTVAATTCSFVITVSNVAGGTLGGATGACTPSTVYGLYSVGTALDGSDTVHVQINVTTAGVYNVTTNSPTGFSFSGTGSVALGVNTITLYGTGSPTTSGPQTLTVTFGTSTCTFIVNVLSNDYFPRTTNSNWSYETDNNPIDSIFRFVIPNTLSALGNTYNIFMQNTSTGPDSSGYYRKSGGNYYEWFDYSNFIGYDPPASPTWAEYIMLKDDQPAAPAAGSNWVSQGFSGTILGNPYTIRFNYTIVQKNVPITVTTSTGSITYQNVIVVQEKYDEFIAGTWVDISSTVGYGKSYYARGIGLITFESYDGTGMLTTPTDRMRRFQVF